MSRARTLAGAAALLAAATGAWAVLAREEAPARGAGSGREPAPLTGGWRLLPGERLSWDLRLLAEVALEPSPLAPGGAPERVSVEVEGTAAWEVLAAGGEGATVRLSIVGATALEVDGQRAEARPGSDFERALAQGLLLALAPDGRLASVRGGDPGSQAGRVLEHLATAMQWVVPVEGGAAWTAGEQDATGSYTARYALQGARVTKAKAYLPLAGEAVRASWSGQVSGAFDARAGHLQALAADEALVVRQGARTLASTRSRLELRLRARERAPLPAASVPALAAPARAPGQPAPASAGDDARLVGGASLLELLEAVPGAHALEAEAASQLQRRLAARVRLTPEAASALAAAALAAPAGDPAEDLLLGALGAAGTPEAEAALLQVVAARGEEEATLVSLAPALALLRAPTPAVEAALSTLAARGGQGGASARLALGAVARTLQAGPSDRARAISGGLVADLEAGRANPVVTLLALGNAGDAATLPAVLARTAPAAPLPQRLAATHALRALPGGAAGDALVALLADGEPSVRAGAARALAARGAEEVALGPLAVALGSDPEGAVRRAALGALSQRTDLPWVRAALEAARRSDPDEGVRALAGLTLGL